MGWTYTYRPRGMTDRAWFADRLGAGFEILDCATVRGTWYAAVRSLRMPDEVWGAVFLTRRVPKARDGYNFGWKDMDETMGPCESRCPARILALLTPLEPGKYPYAEEWRKRCHETARRQAALPKIGQTIRLLDTVTFGGVPESILTKVALPRRRDIYQTPTGRYVRFSNLANYSYEVVA